ncbi:MAG: hypothetical protein ACSLFO_02360 [Acidimicrobiales bacterium]
MAAMTELQAKTAEAAEDVVVEVIDNTTVADAGVTRINVAGDWLRIDGNSHDAAPATVGSLGDETAGPLIDAVNELVGSDFADDDCPPEAGLPTRSYRFFVRDEPQYVAGCGTTGGRVAAAVAAADAAFATIDS